METVRLCKECGAPLSADSAEGLCPKCLIQRGLAGEASGIPASSSEKTILVTDKAGIAHSSGTRVGYFGDYE